MRRCLQRVVVDTSKDINEARRRSDIAGVRTHAQTAAQRRQAGGGASRTYASHVDSDSYSDDDDHHDNAAADDDDHHGCPVFCAPGALACSATTTSAWTPFRVHTYIVPVHVLECREPAYY